MRTPTLIPTTGWSLNVTEQPARSEAVIENAGYLALPLAILVAGIHLTHPTHGLPRLVILILTENLPLLLSDPRPIAFATSGVAILVGIPLAGVGYRRKLLYGLGIILVATYLGGYFAWHLSGHGGFFPGREPLFHGLGPVAAVLEHLSSDTRALVSKLAEIALLAVLVPLYRRE